jgi:hypothetical protein
LASPDYFLPHLWSFFSLSSLLMTVVDDWKEK